MNLNIKKYDLDDVSLLEESNGNLSLKVWKPEDTSVVIGNSNNLDSSLNIKNILEDNVSVYKRPTGGEPVLLSTNVLIISISNGVNKEQKAKEVFKNYNSMIIDALESFNIHNLSQKGISDIAIGEKKILGSSMYRNKDKIFYHAVLNISESPELISRYLNNPGREPDYRKGRDHTEFVTSIEKSGYKIKSSELKNEIEKTFINNFRNKSIISIN